MYECIILHNVLAFNHVNYHVYKTVRCCYNNNVITRLTYTSQSIYRSNNLKYYIQIYVAVLLYNTCVCIFG